jgi:hypothetical protein
MCVGHRFVTEPAAWSKCSVLNSIHGHPDTVNQTLLSPSRHDWLPEDHLAPFLLDVVSTLERILLDGGHSAIAGRLAGALHRADRTEETDEILSTMKRAGYGVHESDPYTNGQTVFAMNHPTEAPIVNRIQALQASTRGAVLEIFPPPI